MFTILCKVNPASKWQFAIVVITVVEHRVAKFVDVQLELEYKLYQN
jgi:hypothetical protein